MLNVVPFHGGRSDKAAISRDTVDWSVCVEVDGARLGCNQLYEDHALSSASAIPIVRGLDPRSWHTLTAYFLEVGLSLPTE